MWDTRVILERRSSCLSWCGGALLSQSCGRWLLAMPFWLMPSRWVVPEFYGRFLSHIGPALPFWVSQKVVRAFLSLQALNSHSSLNSFCNHMASLIACIIAMYSVL